MPSWSKPEFSIFYGSASLADAVQTPCASTSCLLLLPATNLTKPKHPSAGAVLPRVPKPSDDLSMRYVWILKPSPPTKHHLPWAGLGLWQPHWLIQKCDVENSRIHSELEKRSTLGFGPQALETDPISFILPLRSSSKAKETGWLAQGPQNPTWLSGWSPVSNTQPLTVEAARSVTLTSGYASLA